MRVAVAGYPWRDCRGCRYFRLGETTAVLDALVALENGALAHAPPVVEPPVPTAPEVARLWAVSLGLRPGNSMGPAVSALVPVVAKWAAERGWAGVEHRHLGSGLKAAGLVRRAYSGGSVENLSRVLLHFEDAARLRLLCREAWAPARPPGDPLQKWKPRPRPKKLPPAPFHAELRAATRRAGKCAAVCDSTGRVWPSPAHAAQALGCTASTIAASAPSGGGWGAKPAKGLLWRRMLPEEVAAVPAEAVVGQRVGGGWVLLGADRK